MKRLSYILSFAVLAFGLISCGDNGTGSKGDAPAIPSSVAENSKPDISYFEGTSKVTAEKSSSTNFDDAKNTVLGFSSFSYLGQIYAPFFQNAQGSNANFNNGVWEWEYSYSYQGTSASIRLTAEEVANGIYWDMYYTFSSPQYSFDDYNMISGFVHSNGNEGDWTFNTIFDDTGAETPILKSDWEVISNSERTIDIKIYDGQGQVTDIIYYSENGDIHEMYNSSKAVTVYWDTDQEIGYYDPAQGQRVCWSGNATSSTNVDCSSVGLDE
ncbi:MAG: hypothetical protein U5J95_06095 [Balneolaceae bacterium]|nr:hypothetical protein [Balneolaceae bacterium]